MKRQPPNPDDLLCNFVLTEEEENKLRAAAVANACSVSELINALIDRFADRLEVESVGEEITARITRRERSGSDTSERLCALLDLVNLGTCDLSVPSLVDASWRQFSVNAESPLEKPIRDAFRVQLSLIAGDEAPSLPTRVIWAQEDLAQISAERLWQLIWVWRTLDDILKALTEDKDAPRVSRCAFCRGFFVNMKQRGAPRHYCTDEHRESAPGRRDATAYMRGYRRIRRAGALSSGERRRPQ